MKKLILIVTVFILSSCNLSTENKVLKNGVNISERDKAIEEYLLSQNTFSWEDRPFSKRACLFENLWNEDDLFPLSLWVRCSWYMNWEELSWTSIAVLLDYPNELSYYDINKFTHKIPADWSWYWDSIRKLFSKEIQEKIFNNTAWENLSKKMKEIILWEIETTNEKGNIVKTKSNEQIAKENWYYYKSIVAEEKEFNFFDTIENNDFLFKESDEIRGNFLNWDRPICPWMPNKESCTKEWYGNIFNRYTIWENTYDLVYDSSNERLSNLENYFIFKNDELIFEDTIEMVWASSSRYAYNYNWKLLFIYTKNKWDNQVIYNIFYDGEYINKKYFFENIDWFFTYKDQNWFIVDKNKIFFNWKILPYSFDYIQNRACCTAPSLFELYENWKLIFANKKRIDDVNIEFDLIELDLNDYLD